MADKISVMQVTDNLGIGGLERVVANLCKHISRSRFEISVCCLNFKGEFGFELEKEGVSVYQTPKRNTNGTDYLAFWRLKDIMREVRPSIVHTHNTNALLDGAVAALLAGVPIRIHTDHARKFPDKRRYMLAESMLSRFLHKIIAVSNETKNNLIKYEFIPKEKICVIKNGIEGSRYNVTVNTQKKKMELGVGGYKHVVGLGVRLTSQKGITHLIKAAPAVLRQFPETAFLIAGKGALMDSLKLECVKAGVDKNFHFLGPRLDLPEILQILDIYVLPSEWEGLPLVVLEAMAARKPIVATDVGGNSVAIQDGKTGLLVPPQNPDLLADRIIELLKSPIRRQELADNAYAKFYEEFTVEHMVSEYERVYQEVLERKGLSVR